MNENIQVYPFLKNGKIDFAILYDHEWVRTIDLDLRPIIIHEMVHHVCGDPLVNLFLAILSHKQNSSRWARFCALFSRSPDFFENRVRQEIRTNAISVLLSPEYFGREALESFSRLAKKESVEVSAKPITEYRGESFPPLMRKALKECGMMSPPLRSFETDEHPLYVDAVRLIQAFSKRYSAAL